MSKKLTYIKTSSLNRKFTQLVTAFVLLIVTISLWLNVSSLGKAMLEENSIVLAENILLQTSNSARTYISQDDISSLDDLTDSALKSDYILEMVIYDDKGLVLSQSDNAFTTKERFITELNKDVEILLPTPFVKEVRNEDNELLGFVRITVLKKNLQQSGNLFIHRISQQIILLACIAGLIGYLFTIGLRPFSSHSYFVKE
ncbi:hypothetical protein GCM10008107_02750 [Psychrosphaera saromensis]|jgi:uncharacterized membrane protein affecting hemolysin expression|uniref:Uncharacterized protein n=1 Tax=Psychrosphaera saromensis TaxID=716813 RepID=A0A2S7UYF7_9GAMM|nr:AhpA/YtjB family protein [Psychrosphaera saromensis]PQJ54768.1 hypothetical protein BTO11_14655 [Psychrosphaera saromensis]GHB57297.1 hypothetical protein GCM10008107_02750 [Psychrosphaera saromensis]GLQ13997.1 hypothetical protein GCM10007917_14520 [Psychrosphaera saromensis]